MGHFSACSSQWTAGSQKSEVRGRKVEYFEFRIADCRLQIVDLSITNNV